MGSRQAEGVVAESEVNRERERSDVRKKRKKEKGEDKKGKKKRRCEGAMHESLLQVSLLGVCIPPYLFFSGRYPIGRS